MFSLKSITYIIFRGYSRKYPRKIKSQRVISDFEEPESENIFSDVTEDNFDPFEDYDDFNAAESDFMKVGRSYDRHIRETRRAKELLKLRIVARKQFKSTDPSFLTWAEKEQIRSLYNKNSTEWSPERLSESFPALPGAIQKVLKAKWTPTSAESVIKYDQNIINNWKKFKNGSIAVDPQLEEHLKKFQDRKIEIDNLATNAEKFVKQPFKIPVPKSNTFTNVVKNYIENDAQENKVVQPQIVAETKSNTSIKNNNTSIKSDNSIENVMQANKFNKKKFVNFDTFLKNQIDEIAGKSDLSLPNQLLVDEYKKQKCMEALNDDKSAIVEDNEKASSSTIMTAKVPSTTIQVPKCDETITSMGTGILEWKKKTTSSEEDYPIFIKIPRAKSNSGVTFKVIDRYYDCDGEFLYRVPVLKT